MSLSDAQRSFYEANGYLVIPQALGAEELAAVRAAADRAEARWRADPSLPGARGDVLHQVQAPIEYDAALLGLLWQPAVLPLVRAILGDDLQMVKYHTHEGCGFSVQRQPPTRPDSLSVKFPCFPRYCNV